MQDVSVDGVVQAREARILQLERDNRELAASHAQLRAILDNEPECVKLLAADGSLLEMNPAGLRMLEADSLQQVQNHCVYPLIVAEHRAAFRALNEKVLGGGRGLLEFEIVGLKGGRRWLETHASPLRDGSGAITATLGITRDITGRKQAELERADLLEREQHARRQVDRILDSISDAFVSLDKDWRYTYVNQRAGEIFQRRPEDLIGKHIWTEFPEGLGQPFHRAYEKAFAEQLPQTFEDYYPPYDAWFENRIYPYPDGLSIVFTDISERKRSDQRLRESEQQLRSIMDGLGPHMFVGLLDLQGVVLMANRPARSVASLSEEDVIGQPVEDTYWWAYSDAVRLRLRDAVRRAAQGEAVRYDERIRVAEDQFIWLDFSVQPLRDDSGTIVSLLPSAIVIDERKQAEDAVRESEEKFHTAFHSSPVMQVLSTLDGTAVDLNQAYANVLGYTREEMLGKNVVDLQIITAEERDRLIDLARRADGILRNVETTLRARDGSSRQILLAMTMVSLSGVPHRLLGMQDVTESRRSEQALRKVELRLATAVEASNTGLWDWDMRTNTVFYSTIWKRQIGYADHEIGDQWSEWQDRVHPDDVELALARCDAYLKNPTPLFVHEFRLRHKDGSYRWILMNASLQLDEQGLPAHVLGAHIDITERKLAEMALGRSEAILRLFVEHSPAAIAMFDCDMRYIVASHRYLSDFRLGKQTLTGRSHYEVFPDIPEHWKDIHRRCLAGATEKSEEESFPRADGRFDWVRWEVRPWYEAGGEIGGMILFSEVINERKQGEAALLASTEQLRLIYENVEDVVFVLDVEDGGFRFASVNQRFRASTGLAPEQVIGKRVEEVIPEPALGMVLEHYAQAIASGQPVRWEESSVYPTGTRHGEVSVAPIMDAAGKCTQLIGTVHDVTGAMQSRQQLLDAAIRQQALAQRLVEVQEDEQRRLSAELHDRIGQNLTALSINLNIIGSSSAGARTDAASVRLRDSRKLLETTIASVRDLISELRPAVLDDYGLLAGLRWFGEQVRERVGLQISVQGEEPSPRLQPRVESALFRIAQEALTNIVKHAQAQRVVLALEYAVHRVSLRIVDDGCGFEPATLQQHGPGAHWGLQMMHERAEAIGAHMQVESTPGHGTRIVIELEPQS